MWNSKYFLCLKPTLVLNILIIIIEIIEIPRHCMQKLMKVTCFTLKRVSNLDLQCKFGNCFKRIQTVWTSNRPLTFVIIVRKKNVMTPHRRWLNCKKIKYTMNKTSHNDMCPSHLSSTFFHRSTPYSKMATILVFFCLLANQPLLSRLRETILLHFEFKNEAVRANLQEKQKNTVYENGDTGNAE